MSSTPDTAIVAANQANPPETDMVQRRKFYQWFVRGAFLLAAHAVVILLVLGYIFSDGMG